MSTRKEAMKAGKEKRNKAINSGRVSNAATGLSRADEIEAMRAKAIKEGTAKRKKHQAAYDRLQKRK